MFFSGFTGFFPSICQYAALPSITESVYRHCDSGHRLLAARRIEGKMPTFADVKKSFLFLLCFYAATLLVFTAGRWAFCAHGLGMGLLHGLLRVPEVSMHGFLLDVAAAGYAAMPILLFLMVAVWWRPLRTVTARRLYRVYAGLLALLVSAVTVGDAVLYPYWHFKIDATVLAYIGQPGGALSSVSAWQSVCAVAGWLLFAAVAFLLWQAPLRVPAGLPQGRGGRTAASVMLLLLGGLMFLGIRGGIGRSTANVGMAYYSNDNRLNHAAVNPAFSLLSSIGKTHDFARQFRFMEEKGREALWKEMGFAEAAAGMEVTDTLLTTTRPNIVLILMEGMGASFVSSLGGAPGVTPCIDSLAGEGVWFANCYANSFRTDRGTVCALSGYAGAPTVSVMRQQQIVDRLPGLAGTLARAGYDTEFLYGGDINFTGTKGYLMQTGYARALGDGIFPVSVRRSHAWGVTDAIAFDTLYSRISSKPAGRPWHEAFLTLASHEPWEVPYDRIKGDMKANAMAYLDSCIGRFVERMKSLPSWKNTLIVILPDHGILYPEGTTEEQPAKHHIPMLWVGGAVKKPVRIAQVCNQSDLAATLLSQLGLPHADYRFSRNVLSPGYKPMAFFTWASGAGCIDADGGATVYDVSMKRILSDSPQPSQERWRCIQAYLQTVYDDLGRK